MRYACSICLRLRGHTHFDNHSILRLRTPKPPPSSRAATKLTSWKLPCAPRVRYTRLQALACADAAEENLWSAVYSAAIRDFTRNEEMELAEMRLVGSTRQFTSL